MAVRFGAPIYVNKAVAAMVGGVPLTCLCA